MPKPKSSTDQDTFHDVVTAIDAGEVDPSRHLSIQIDQSLRDAICAAKASGQAAGVTISLKVQPKDGRRVSFAGTISTKLPRPPVAAVTLYADEAGNVHGQDPDQMRLPYSSATAPKDEEN